MLVQHSGYPAQRVKVLDGERRLVGLDTGDHLEMHHVPRHPVDIQRDHAAPVAGGQHGGHRDVAVTPQCVEPDEF